MSEIIEDIKYKYGVPDYNYLKYIKTPNDKGVTRNTDMISLMKNTMALPYWLEVLALGWGSTSSGNYKNGKGSFNTSGKLGNRYKIQTGYCKDGKTPRWTWINNVKTGNLQVYNPITRSITEIPTPFYGLVPGLLQDTADINPVALFKAVSGKGTMLGECFIDYRKEVQYKSFIMYVIIFLLIIVILKYGFKIWI